MILAVEAVEVDFHSLIPGMNSNDFGYGSGNFKPFGVKIGKVSQFTLYRLPEGVYNPNLLGNRKKRRPTHPRFDYAMKTTLALPIRRLGGIYGPSSRLGPETKK